MWCIIPIIGPTFSLMLVFGWTFILTVCSLSGHPFVGTAAGILSLFAIGFAF